MRLIVTGCEYTGKSTLAKNILDWIKANMGNPICGWHDHFVLPFSEGEGPEVEEEAQQVLTLKPRLLEKYARYMVDYHFNSAFYGDDHHLCVDWYYAEAVYAPLYYGYGRPGEYADRWQMARHHDSLVEELGPDTVLILLKASPEVVRQRMQQNPHRRGILKDQDVETVLERFQKQFTETLIRRRFVLDTTSSTPEATFQEWLRLMEPHITPADRSAVLMHRLVQPTVATPA